MPPATIRRRKLYEEIADDLERMIQDGQYAPEDLLPSERDLMSQYGVGRPAVREALFHLRKMGLVEVRSGERARVTRPTPAFVIGTLSGTARHMLAAPGGVQDFQNARLFFETGLARHAALHAGADDLAAFEAALAANRAAIGDLRRFRDSDVAFHYVLALIPRNAIFTAIHAALADWLTEQRQTTLAPAQDNALYETVYEAHRAIFEGVASRDPDRAERAMREHLDYVSRRYAAVVEGRR
ncbi:transcriptional regulator NanR [Labrys wisconsinensis]|uniref:GntR family transcriptional repressor for pyruvate dehydrogenase complex n=1 Tax=Labrys wisconsinensis TaxID=425677 RepID=A0ABU0JEG5_9HYPH|nr:transcriptional regulator NanR [Labrys wisconsinensis]MDQ0471901.1 GntR family transcriptional repressor for pyruvate dehydrogenase complex [Labrys wisconsinensis]